MKYIKAKFEKSLRSYTYKTDDEVIPGDIVQTEKGVKLTVVDEEIDMSWVEAYGEKKVAVVKKCEKQGEGENENA